MYPSLLGTPPYSGLVGSLASDSVFSSVLSSDSGSDDSDCAVGVSDSNVSESDLSDDSGFDATVNPFYNVYFSATLEYDPYFNSFSNGYIYGHTKTRDWKFGVRWDYTKNFENEIYDFHALALEGGSKLGEHWSFSAWVKYDFSQSYFPYANLDLIYNSQCWGITLHTYYKNDRVQDFITGDYIDSNEVRFGISISLKNVDSVDTNSFGDFDW